MCGGGGVQDNSDKVAAIEAAAAEKKRLADAEELRRKEAQFAERLSQAYDTAINSAKNYFTQMGLDPSQYMEQIISEANNKKGLVPSLDASPSTYFNNLGESVFNSAQSGERAKALREIEKFAGTGFEKSMLADTADDNSVQALLEDMYGDASTKLDAQKSRGILTDAGFAKAMQELGKQKTRAKLDLDVLGGSILAEGRNKLNTTAADAKSRANALMLGSSFDPFATQKALSDEATAFLQSLNSRLEAEAPEDLFDILKAQTAGGIAQGALNNPYDKNASQGIFDIFAQEEEARKKKKDETIFTSAF